MSKYYRLSKCNAVVFDVGTSYVTPLPFLSFRTSSHLLPHPPSSAHTYLQRLDGSSMPDIPHLILSLQHHGPVKSSEIRFADLMWRSMIGTSCPSDIMILHSVSTGTLQRKEEARSTFDDILGSEPAAPTNVTVLVVRSRGRYVQ